MANEIFNETEFLNAIDQSKLSDQGKVEFAKRIADIEKKKASAQQQVKFAGIKVKYELAVKPLLDKIAHIPINSNVNIIQIILTKDIQNSVFTESIVNQTHVKMKDPENTKVPVFCNMLLELAEYDDIMQAINTTVKKFDKLTEKYGGGVLVALSNYASANESKKRIQRLIADNPIPFDQADLDGLDGLKYVISGEHTKTELGNTTQFIWTARVDMSRKIEGAKTPSEPKLDADGNKINGTKETGKSVGYKSLDDFLAAQPAESYLGRHYAKVSDAIKAKAQANYYVKKAISIEKGIEQETVKLADYIGQ